jgi:BirA family transcriptional regulator, biotin operon repressor / biotin---[acetyl-CoA-carboxylase] ligase
MHRTALATVIRHFEHHAEIGSTNDRGMELARDESVALPALVVAGKQTAGRGRGANRWWSGDGALTFSLVVDIAKLEIPRERWPLVALTAGMAVCDALQPIAGNTPLAIKWPNDVFAGGRKLCGILVETPASPAGRVVIGIGVNVNNSFAAAPEDVRSRAISLVDVCGRPSDLDSILISLVGELIEQLPTIAATPPGVVDRWQCYCMLSGRNVELETPAGSLRGHCRGIDDDGALLLHDVSGPQRCIAGTVVQW